MRRIHVSGACAAIAAVLAVAVPSLAGAASKRVERACADDVQRLCPKHKADSPALRYCMEAKSRYISRRCVHALEDAGEIPRGYFDK